MNIMSWIIHLLYKQKKNIHIVLYLEILFGSECCVYFGSE